VKTGVVDQSVDLAIKMTATGNVFPGRSDAVLPPAYRSVRGITMLGEGEKSARLQNPPYLHQSDAGSGIEHKVQVITTVSNDASANGRSSAEAVNNEMGTWQSAIRFLAMWSSSMEGSTAKTRSAVSP
jgi:hypothetical protein